MSTKELLKHTRALQQKKFRDQHGLFLVQGRKVVAEVLASPLDVVEVFAMEEAARDMALKQAHILPAHDLERIGTFEHGNEVVAVVRKPEAAQPAFPGKGAFVLAVDHVADPGNLGTLLRIADWFGAGQLWCAEGSVEAWNPKCVQAAMGSLFRIPVVYTDLAATLRRTAEAGVNIYKAEASGANVFTVELQRPAVLVLGSESHGLSKAVIDGPGTSIAIPAFGGAESLNVAAAAAALCMELVREG